MPMTDDGYSDDLVKRAAQALYPDRGGRRARIAATREVLNAIGPLIEANALRSAAAAYQSAAAVDPHVDAGELLRNLADAVEYDRL